MDDEGGSELGLEKIFRLNCRAEQHTTQDNTKTKQRPYSLL